MDAYTAAAQAAPVCTGVKVSATDSSETLTTTAKGPLALAISGKTFTTFMDFTKARVENCAAEISALEQPA